MTVLSINKQALEQSNLTHASAKAGGMGESTQALFTAALAQHQVRVGPASPATDTVFKAKLDRPVAEPRPERAERPAKAAERPDRRPAERFERPKAAPAERASRPAANARPEPQARATDAPTAEKTAPAPTKPQSATSRAATKAEPAQESVAAVQQTGEAVSASAAVAAFVSAVEPAPVMAPDAAVVVPAVDTETAANVQVAAAPVMTAAIAPAPVAEGAEPEADFFTLLAKEYGPQIKDLESKIDAGDALDDLDIDFANFAPVAAQAQATTQQPSSSQAPAAIAPQIADDLVTAQAADMARMLAGTGANVKVAVKVDAAPQAATDPAALKVDPALSPEEQAAQILSSGGSANGKGQASSQQGNSQQGGQQNAGLANAGQQVAGNPAIANAQAAAAARPFAAQLAAQIEGGSSQGGPQAASAPTAAMGPGAAQGTAKPAPAQAAQAPHQPRHVDPKQVIDQVSVQIARQAKGGADTIRVQLKPVDLGRIEIRLEVQDGKVTAHVSADNKETLAVLQKDARGLERALQDAGLKTEASSMNFSLSGDGQQARNDAKPVRRSRLSRAAKPAEDAPQQAAAQPMRSGGRRGVDIKV